MKLSSQQKDRAAGILLGQAIGDALGVPYEFAAPITAGQARMIGGGLGPYAPGEWSDDTQMALCIARVTATGADLTTDAALDAVAQGFLDWQADGASDIGNQTRSVLNAARRGTGPLAGRMTDAALSAARDGRAGNGALMRTGIIGLVALEDPDTTAAVARRVAALTHADDRCVDSCVLWSEAVRVAVTEGRLDIRAGLPQPLLPAERQAQWLALIEQAETQPPAAFGRNGYTVTAFQAAWSAIHATGSIEGPYHVEAALQTAIAIGHDTDTIAAIAGALLGARYGVSGLATDLVRRVHGWPGLRARDLVRLALATGGRTDSGPATGSMVRGDQRPLGRPHPDDLDVILGTEADLARCAELGITAVVSLSRVGEADIRAAGVQPGNHIEVRLIDSEDPDNNAHLAWTLEDAARTIDLLRAEGERVLVHCVAAQHRTPAAALAYSLYIGQTPGRAQRQIEARLNRRIGGLLWQTAGRQTRAPRVASHNLAGALASYRDGRGTYEELKDAVRLTRFTPRPRRRTTTLADLFDDEEYTVVAGSFQDAVGEAVFTGTITSQQYGELLAIHDAELETDSEETQR